MPLSIKYHTQIKKNLINTAAFKKQCHALKSTLRHQQNRDFNQRF